MNAGPYLSPGSATWNGKTYTTMLRTTEKASTASSATDIVLMASQASP